MLFTLQRFFPEIRQSPDNATFCFVQRCKCTCSLPQHLFGREGLDIHIAMCLKPNSFISACSQPVSTSAKNKFRQRRSKKIPGCAFFSFDGIQLMQDNLNHILYGRNQNFGGLKGKGKKKAWLYVKFSVSYQLVLQICKESETEPKF